MTDIAPRTWGYYAQRVYEQCQRTGRQIHNRRQFEDAVAADGIRRLSEQAKSWNELFDIEPHRLAEALADGTAPRYARRRT